MKKIFLFLNKKDRQYYLAFIIIAIILNYIFFNKVNNNQFLFIHDQFFRFSLHETSINSFFIRIPENLSVINSWYFIWYFWDIIFYLIVYSLNISLLNAEKLLFFVVLIISMLLSFSGLKKIAANFDQKITKSSIFIITLWYCFNPYTAIQWHTGNYNISLGLLYSLTPLTIYYIHIVLFSKFKIRNIIILAILLFISSTVFWLFAALIFFLAFYSTIYLLLNRKLLKSIIVNIIALLMMYLPLAGFIIFSIFYELYNNKGDSNTSFLPTYGLQQGGLVYQMLLLSSWAIYTIWNPRSLFSFGYYYFSRYYFLSTLSIYLIILIGIFIYLFIRISPIRQFIERIKHFSLNKKDKLLLTAILLLFISVFFAKAGQPPLGEMFIYLYNHIPLFTVFRSADIRFGFPIITSITLLLIYVSKYFNKYVFFLIFFLILIIQNIFFFNGATVFGENIKNLYYDRVTYYSKSHQQLINFLNNEPDGSGYVLTIPSAQFGHYFFDENEHFIGQDILAKSIKMPFLYPLESKCTAQICAISEKTNKQLLKILKSKDISDLNNFPIRYIIHRKDIVCSSCLDLNEKNLNNKFTKVFNNDHFTVYKINKFSPLINTRNNLITFVNINPVKYRIHIENIRNKLDLNLLLSYNKDWKLFLNKYNNKFDCVKGKKITYSNISECTNAFKFFEGEELIYILKKPIFEKSHTFLNGYANKWTIDPIFIKSNFDGSYYTTNKDGSININLIIYYQPQSWLYGTLIISVFTFFAIALYLIHERYYVKVIKIIINIKII